MGGIQDIVRQQDTHGGHTGHRETAGLALVPDRQPARDQGQPGGVLGASEAREGTLLGLLVAGQLHQLPGSVCWGWLWCEVPGRGGGGLLGGLSGDPVEGA